MQHRLALRRQALLLTVIACFGIVVVVPSWRRTLGYFANPWNPYGMASVSLHSSGHRWGDTGWIYVDSRSFRGGQDRWVRQWVHNLQRLAERTGKADDWLAAAEAASMEDPMAPATADQTRYYDKALAAAPNSPLIIAQALNYRLRRIDLVHPDNYRFWGNPVPHPLPRHFTMAEWQAAEHLARRGMQMAPNNSLFDYIEACLMFSVQRDGEGFRYLHEGTTKPGYADYIVEAHQSFFRAEKATGLPPLESAAMASSGPRTALVRFSEMKEIVAYEAGEARKQGDAGRAARIIQDGMTLGAHLQDSSSGILGALVGMEVQNTFLYKTRRTLSPDMRREKRKNEYVRKELKSYFDRPPEDLRLMSIAMALASGLMVFPYAVLLAIVALALSWRAGDPTAKAIRWRWPNTAGCVLTILAVQGVALSFGWAWSLLPDHPGLMRAWFPHLVLPVIVTLFAIGGVLLCVWAFIRSLRTTPDAFLTVAVAAGALLCDAAVVTIWMAYRAAVEGAAKDAVAVFGPWVLALHFGAPLAGVLIYALSRARKQWRYAVAGAEQRPPSRRFLVPNLRPACATAVVLCALAGTALMPILVHARARATTALMSSDHHERALLDRLLAEADKRAAVSGSSGHDAKRK